MNEVMKQEIDKLLNTSAKDTVVVNFYGGPGSGKSTMCAHTFAELKWSDVDCEMAREYAKDKVWEKNKMVFENQLYILGKQYYRMKVLDGQVDVIITDSPLLFSLVYGDPTDIGFAQVIKDRYNSFVNLDYFVTRQKKYNPNGRHQTYEQAVELDNRIIAMLNENNVNYKTVEGSRFGVIEVVKDILTFKRVN